MIYKRSTCLSVTFRKILFNLIRVDGRCIYWSSDRWIVDWGGWHVLLHVQERKQSIRYYWSDRKLWSEYGLWNSSISFGKLRSNFTGKWGGSMMKNIQADFATYWKDWNILVSGRVLAAFKFPFLPKIKCTCVNNDYTLVGKNVIRFILWKKQQLWTACFLSVAFFLQMVCFVCIYNLKIFFILIILEHIISDHITLVYDISFDNSLNLQGYTKSFQMLTFHLPLHFLF